MNLKKEYPLDKIKSILKEQEQKLNEIQRYAEKIEKVHYDLTERKIILKRIKILKQELRDNHDLILQSLQNIEKEEVKVDEEKEKKSPIEEDENYLFQHKGVLRTRGGKIYDFKKVKVQEIEKQTFDRLREDRKKKEKAAKKPKQKKTNKYSEISSQFFSKVSKKLLGTESFKTLERDLIKANLDYAPTGYISMILFTTVLATIIGGFVFLFFLFFNVEATVPFLTRASESINIRFFKVFWILFLSPIGTFVMMYFYPSMEKKSAESKINLELPFASIHMAAISGSMINPIKIFEIIISTKEYPAIEKEFTKMLNEINVYGSDLVNAMKNSAKNTSSKKLSELLNGLATTINSGGDLVKFFEKRSESLLFEYKIEKEKATKHAESFMDVYISVLIAAPMVIMLLMMMMKISGLGLSASVSAITLVIILGVTMLNIGFITFLHLKRKE